MNQQTSFKDDDPAAPWMLDKRLGGMTPSFPPEKLGSVASAGERGVLGRPH